MPTVSLLWGLIRVGPAHSQPPSPVVAGREVDASVERRRSWAASLLVPTATKLRPRGWCVAAILASLFVGLWVASVQLLPGSLSLSARVLAGEAIAGVSTLGIASLSAVFDFPWSWVTLLRHHEIRRFGCRRRMVWFVNALSGPTFFAFVMVTIGAFVSSVVLLLSNPTRSSATLEAYAMGGIASIGASISASFFWLGGLGFVAGFANYGRRSHKLRSELVPVLRVLQNGGHVEPAAAIRLMHELAIGFGPREGAPGSVITSDEYVVSTVLVSTFGSEVLLPFLSIFSKGMGWEARPNRRWLDENIKEARTTRDQVDRLSRSRWIATIEIARPPKPTVGFAAKAIDEHIARAKTGSGPDAFSSDSI